MTILTQKEADDLLKMHKCRVDDTIYAFPTHGRRLNIPLKSRSASEDFMLDIHQGGIALKRYTFQHRARNIIILARLDLGGPLHRNPDGTEIPCPLKNDQLITHASAIDFPLKKHNIIQAMLAINDLFYLSSSHISNLFIEDVTKWLDIKNIRYTPRVKFVGKSGYDHMFNFVIPKSEKYPERLLEILTHPKKDKAQELVFKWIDTKEERPTGSKLLVLLNDETKNIPQSVIEALSNYELEPILWTEREKFSEIFAA
ncbi:MAG: DUF1829 domain-containing protein [Chlamydiales bacterium]|nr:DUF1829 domain-containing protein [Chlamydiales bacterium]